MMDWSKFIPALFEALTGNELSAAEDAAEAIAGIFGWTDKSVGGVKSQLSGPQLSMTSDQQIQLMQLENEAQQNRYQAYVEQVSDAENARQEFSKSYVPPALSFLTIGLVAAFIFYMFDDKTWLNDKVMVGMIGWMGHAAWKKLDQVYDYWFGSLFKSKEKQE